MTISSMDFFGPNAGYLAELYERYQTDPGSVELAARQAFDSGLRPPPANVPAPVTNANTAIAIPSADTIAKIVGAARVARFVRELGHLDAHLDPLGGEPPSDPALQLANSGLTDADLEALPASVIGGQPAQNEPNAKTALAKLRRAYSGFVGYEDDHIQIAEERNWLRDAVESGMFFKNFGPNDKREVLERLTEVDGFEQFLDKTPPFQGQKRFSIEGQRHDGSHSGYDYPLHRRNGNARSRFGHGAPRPPERFDACSWASPTRRFWPSSLIPAITRTGKPNPPSPVRRAGLYRRREIP